MHKDFAAERFGKFVDATGFLQKAKDMVADYVDGVSNDSNHKTT